MSEDTFTPEQIESWRRVIFMQLEDKMSGAGSYALIMPESAIIEYAQKVQSLFNTPTTTHTPSNQRQFKSHKSCDHSNSFTGNNGKYCVDCEKYV